MSHTAACVQARGTVDSWPMMYSLSIEAQEAVMDCPDESHDSVRLALCERPWRPPWLDVVS